MTDNPTEPTYVIAINSVTGWRTPVSWDAVLKAADLDGYTIVTDYRRTPKRFDPLSIRQHPGVDHCNSCIEDENFDAEYSMYPQCCCRSEIPLEWLESRMGATK